MEKTLTERKLKPDKNFTPVTEDGGDELFPIGIFIFNITKMLEFIKSKPEIFVLERIAVKKYRSDPTTLAESHIDSVDCTRPIILAEISPGKFSIIDGNHRIEKAGRTGIENILAYRLGPEHHLSFLTSVKAYNSYIDYWNGKLDDIEEDRSFKKNNSNCLHNRI